MKAYGVTVKVYPFGKSGVKAGVSLVGLNRAQRAQRMAAAKRKAKAMDVEEFEAWSLEECRRD